jgi:hypothetical protein
MKLIRLEGQRFGKLLVVKLSGKRDTFTFEEWYGMTAYFRK